MSMDEVTKHTISVVATVTPPTFYMAAISTAITIAVGTASLLWFIILFWEKFFPLNFRRFIDRLNRREK